VMIAKLFHVEPPEWVTGSLGLVFIALAVVSSVVHERRRARAEMQGLHFAPIKEGAR
jgi:hypothetical protein